MQVTIPMEEIADAVKKNIAHTQPLKDLEHNMVQDKGQTFLVLSFQVENVQAVETQEMRLEINFIEKEPEDGEENDND